MNPEPAHLADCTGNGSEPCWDCGGDGFVQIAEDDDPMADREYTCETCRGKGEVRCPGCLAMDPPDEVNP